METSGVSNSTKRRKSSVSKEENETRRLAQASRTLKACQLCRKQKTRCFRSPEDTNRCLRCKFLSKTCSFELDEDIPQSNTVNVNSSPIGDSKLDQIHQGVNEILSILKNKHNDLGNDRDAELLVESVNSMHSTKSAIFENEVKFDSPSKSFKLSPISIIGNYLNEKPSEVKPDQILNLYPIDTIPHTLNYQSILDLNIISETEVLQLINDFRRNYGRWVSFPSGISNEDLVNDIKLRSPLLLTSCCLISLKYSVFDEDDVDEKKLKYLQLIKQVVRDLNHSSLKYSLFKADQFGLVEHLQAIVILSIYSTSISSMVSTILKDGKLPLEFINDNELQRFNLDPWLLSCNGLTTYLTSSTFGNLHGEPLTILRIYNHLCLAHLVNSIFSGRMSILDDVRIENCASALSLLNATNFDGRMVSEIGILYIAYKYIQSNINETNIDRVNHNFQMVFIKIDQWYENWEYLFNQPALQFIEFNYNFCSMLITYVYTYKILSFIQRDQAESMFEADNLNFVFDNCQDEANLHKMFEFAIKSIGYINSIKNDSYFAYLSDQLHFCFYFTGIFTIKLIKCLIKSPRLVDSVKVNQAVKNIKIIIEKFDRISLSNQRDLLTKYKLGLQMALNET